MKRLVLVCAVLFGLLATSAFAQSSGDGDTVSVDSIAYRSAVVAFREVGTVERPKGSNCGVSKYGGQCGQPWSGWFVNWAARSAGDTKMPRSGSIANLKAWAIKKNRYQQESDLPRRGDIAIYGNAAHAGVILRVTVNGKRVTLTTVEGNYSDQVKIVKRRIGTDSSDVTGYIKGSTATYSLLK